VVQLAHGQGAHQDVDVARADLLGMATPWHGKALMTRPRTISTNPEFTLDGR